MSDLLAIIYWWFFLFLLGAIVWPITWKKFHKFWDRGYGLTKIVGIAIVSWLVWVISILKLFSGFSTEVIWGVIIITALYNWLFVARREGKEFIEWHRKNFRTIVFEESLFATAFSLWAIVRGFQPDIEGLEKFMDFGFMNAILRSKYFPPADMWWAGGQINYYYFGHYIAALLTKLSGIEPSVTYNLALSHLFGLGMVATFSLASNLTKIANEKISRRTTMLSGLISAFLLNLAGNTHTIYAFLKTYDPDKPMPPWKLGLDFNLQAYWYPNATRFIPYTIHEFPIYSYVVADLHGHVSDIPFVLLFLGLLVASNEEKGKSRVKKILGECLPLGMLLGIMIMTNYWDLPIYGLIYGVTTWIVQLRRGGFWRGTREAIVRGAIVLLVSLIAASGFLVYFKQIAEGIKFVNARSAIYQLFILWGWPLFLSVSFLCLSLGKRKNNVESDFTVIGWIAVAWLLILIPEIIYVKDIYVAEYHRANTMFKLVYQSFVIFSVVSGYIIVKLWGEAKKWNRFARWGWRGALFICLGLISIYPWFAIKSYYGDLKNYKGLYGMHFLDKSPGDLAAIYWLKKNVLGIHVLLEAPGDSYTTYNRVSAMTGLPTIVGWAVHEWLWRGGYDQVGARITEVENIYTDATIGETKESLLKYGVEYIIVGEKEKEKYGERLNLTKLAKLGQVVFDYQGTKIYKMNL